CARRSDSNPPAPYSFAAPSSYPTQPSPDAPAPAAVQSRAQTFSSARSLPSWPAEYKSAIPSIPKSSENFSTRSDRKCRAPTNPPDNTAQYSPEAPDQDQTQSSSASPSPETSTATDATRSKPNSRSRSASANYSLTGNTSSADCRHSTREPSQSTPADAWERSSQRKIPAPRRHLPGSASSSADAPPNAAPAPAQSARSNPPLVPW